jgi:molybdenum cofactor cytidylyltransferase
LKFGPVPVDEALGCILAHGTLAGAQKIKKGTRLGADHIAALKAHGIAEVIAARLDAGDLSEDEAAGRLSKAICGENIECAIAATGRVNLYAKANGLLVVDKASVDRLNRLDPGITFATLPEFAPVTKGQMTATVKIIPFAVSGELIAKVEAEFASLALKRISVAAFSPRKTSVISTVLPGLKPTVIDKTLDVLKARLSPSGSELFSDARARHDERAVADAIVREQGNGSELIVIFGASAVVDADDVIPAAIRLAGGLVEHVGMPVDPGNLLVLGHLGAVPVIGAPGCARSPKENGFDYVLNRLLADIPVTPHDITGMGVGGLLMEIPSRPQLREAAAASIKIKIAALVLAAGQSRRSGASHKLRATFDGVPLLRRICGMVLDAGFSKAVVVLGFEEDSFASQLASLPIKTVINPRFAEGLSTSLQAGIQALDADADGALVMLADMPGLTAANIVKLADAFKRAGGTAIVRATDNGKRGNPVILPRIVFPEIFKLRGDVGAKPIVEGFEGRVIDVEIGAAASQDVDTEAAISAAGGILSA